MLNLGLLNCKGPQSNEVPVTTPIRISEEMSKLSDADDKSHALPSPIWLFVGDSLTAGYGVEPELSFVSRLQEKLRQEDWVEPRSHKTPILRNAGVSGDTSAGTLRRIDWLLEDRVDRVFLCIGANDGMRGQPIEALRSNLSEIASKIRERGPTLHLMQMFLPPNYGEDYTKRFAESYQVVAESEGLSLFPFLLNGVAGESEYNQADGIHPNEEGHQKVADQLLSHLTYAGLIVKRSSAKLQDKTGK